MLLSGLKYMFLTGADCAAILVLLLLFLLLKSFVEIWTHKLKPVFQIQYDLAQLVLLGI